MSFTETLGGQPSAGPDAANKTEGAAKTWMGTLPMFQVAARIRKGAAFLVLHAATWLGDAGTPDRYAALILWCAASRQLGAVK